jgi:hypothetical protein
LVAFCGKLYSFIDQIKIGLKLFQFRRKKIFIKYKKISGNQINSHKIAQNNYPNSIIENPSDKIHQSTPPAEKISLIICHKINNPNE